MLYAAIFYPNDKLIPSNATTYEFQQETGKLVSSGCNFYFKSHYKVDYRFINICSISNIIAKKCIEIFRIRLLLSFIILVSFYTSFYSKILYSY